MCTLSRSGTKLACSSHSALYPWEMQMCPSLCNPAVQGVSHYVGTTILSWWLPGDSIPSVPQIYDLTCSSQNHMRQAIFFIIVVITPLIFQARQPRLTGIQLLSESFMIQNKYRSLCLKIMSYHLSRFLHPFFLLRQNKTL